MNGFNVFDFSLHRLHEIHHLLGSSFGGSSLLAPTVTEPIAWHSTKP